MPIFLKALALKNYRGIGDTFQTMPAFKTFNFFIGANNSGKSTILNFIAKHLPPRLSGRQYIDKAEPSKVEPLERHEGKFDRSIGMAMGFAVADVIHHLE